MSYLVVGPLVGVVLVVVLSLVGILVSQTLGGNVSIVTLQIQTSAALVLLVTILSRLESKRPKD
jgi:hypothetical protein